MSDTKTVSGNIVHIQDKGAPTALSVIVDINPKQSGSGTPSPSNVRPISGWESVNVGVNGKNFFPRIDGGTKNGITATVNSDGSVTLVGTATASATFYKSFTLKAGRYIITDNRPNVDAVCYLNGVSGSTSTGATLNIPNDIETQAVVLVYNGRTVNQTLYPMLRLASDTDPTYEPYNGHTTTTSLGRTVYGGTLDVVSGVLTDKMGIVDLGDINWRQAGSTSVFYASPAYSSVVGTIKCDSTSRDFVANAVCSQYAVVSRNTMDSSNNCVAINKSDTTYISVKDSRYTDATAFKAAMSGVKFCYELATPQTYTLTGQNVPLLKDCYAWADSGDISITYETYLINGLFHKIWINGVKMFAPNDFTLERSDVYAGEITTCTGKTIADRIGWKYADMSLNWDYLPQEYLEVILNLSGVFTIKFENEEGVQFTEQCIRKGSTMTGTRFTDVHGNMMWKGVQFDISFINVHN